MADEFSASLAALGIEDTPSSGALTMAPPDLSMPTPADPSAQTQQPTGLQPPPDMLPAFKPMEMRPPPPVISSNAKDPTFGYKYNKTPPQFTERKGRTLYQNFADDVADMIQGTSALTNAAVLRGIQAIPKETNISPLAQGRPLASGIGQAVEGFTEGLDKLPGPVERIKAAPQLFGEAVKRVQKDPDIAATKAMVQGLGQYYGDRYIAPFSAGLGAGGLAVGEQLWKHPLGTSLDLGAGPGIETGLGVGANLAMKGAKAAPRPLLKMVGKGPYRAMAKKKRAFQAALNEPITTPKWLKGLFQTPMGLKSKYIVGTQPLQAPWQALQNAATVALTRLNSPQDIIYGLAGMLMATDKRFHKWVPTEFFSGNPELAAQLPRWLAVLSFPDELINKHLQVIQAGDNYWRAATALTLAVKETARVANAQQFKLLSHTLGLTFWAQKNIKRLLNDERMASEWLKEVHRTLGNYDKQFTLGNYDKQFTHGPEALLASNVIFYKAMRHLMILSSTFPSSNPYKTAVLHGLSEVMIKAAETEPMNSKVRKGGAVIARNPDGSLILGNDGIPLVYVKGAGVTPLLASYQNLQFLLKMVNREGLGDVDLSFSALAPFWDIGLGLGGINSSTMQPFNDPSAARDTFGAQVSKANMDKTRGQRVSKDDIHRNPAPPVEHIFGKALAPTMYQSLLQFHEYMQKIPGTPSDFSTIAGEPAPRRKSTGQKIKPLPMTPGSVLFGKLQPTQPSISKRKEQQFDRIQEQAIKKSYRRKRRQWQN